MLSAEMPVHQLSKSGYEEINIIRRSPKDGRVILQWKVEPNTSVGAPRQLAYRLDTWVVKRRLDQLPRPIPRIIRIGDLREVARELNHGGDTASIKTAFEQNASAFIRAKLPFRTRDGQEEFFEGYFNRYNVFFRGQSLPDGGRAQTVYLGLNDPYYSLINRSTWRPLDYRYLHCLTPAAQRFYELISPKMFAAIKNGHPAAWIRYSDFCSLAVLRRHATRARMQSQMATLHRQHLDSGYVLAISWQMVRNAHDRVPDWAIHYTPGPRAFAEFELFNGERSQSSRVRNRPLQAIPRPNHRAVGPVELTAGPTTASPALEIAQRFAQRRHGIEGAHPTDSQLNTANAILDAAGGDITIARIAVDLAARAAPQDRKGFPSLLGGVLKGGFVEQARAAREEEERRAESERKHHREDSLRTKYEGALRRRAADRVASLTSAERQQLVDVRLSRYVEEYRFLVQQRRWTDEQTRAWAEPRILDRYGHEGEPSFEDWCGAQSQALTDAVGPQGPTVTPTG